MLPTYGDRLINVGSNEPDSTIFIDEYGAQHSGSIVPVIEVDLTQEQIELGFPMGYDSESDMAIIHPVQGPIYQDFLNDSTRAAADLNTERPQLKSLLTQALNALDTDETQRTQDLIDLANATSLAQAKPIITHMLSREHLRINIDRRVLRALATAIGIAL